MKLVEVVEILWYEFCEAIDKGDVPALTKTLEQAHYSKTDPNALGYQTQANYEFMQKVIDYLIYELEHRGEGVANDAYRTIVEYFAHGMSLERLVRAILAEKGPKGSVPEVEIPPELRYDVAYQHFTPKDRETIQGLNEDQFYTLCSKVLESNNRRMLTRAYCAPIVCYAYDHHLIPRVNLLKQIMACINANYEGKNFKVGSKLIILGE